MKQLFLLVTKYIRRQRFRTTLTFLCVLLSVFVFNLLCDAFVVIRGISIASLTQDNGEWEAELHSLIGKTDDKRKAAETIRNSKAVERCFSIDLTSIFVENQYRDAEGYEPYLEYTVNGGAPSRTQYFTQQNGSGDTELADSYMFYNATSSEVMEGGIMLPQKFMKEGYKVGDEITVTLTAKRARFPDEQPVLQDALTERIQRFQEKYGKDRKYRLYLDSPGDEESGVCSNVTLLTFAHARKAFDQLVVEDVHSSEPYTFKTKIMKFHPEMESAVTVCADPADIDITECLNGEFASAKDAHNRQNAAYGGSAADYGTDSGERPDNSLRCENASTVRIVTNQRMDFDDAMEALYQELGLPEDEMDETLHSHDDLYNTTLLMLRFRGADSYARWFDSLDNIIALVVFAVVALLVWALMRFVIDNAFEISVQERSAQFATLRIMGASRKQIGTVVALEAVFYCIASIPLGMLLSYLCRSAVFSALENYGIHVKYTSFPALSVVAAILALTAVLVSSYTSSMWAARAYSPLEASRKTKLKGNKKESFWTKDLFGSKPKKDKKEEKAERKAMPTGDLRSVKRSKLNRKQKSFLRNYSMRNIRRTRSRFVISVISMSLGTMLFAFGLTIGIAVTWSLRPYFNGMENSYDFIFHVADFPQQVEQTAEKLTSYIQNNHDRFKVDKSIEFPFMRDDQSQTDQAVADLLEPDYAFTGDWTYKVVDASMYDQLYADITGMDYKTFVESGGVLVDENLCGSAVSWKADANGSRKPEKTGRPSSFKPDSGKHISLAMRSQAEYKTYEGETNWSAMDQKEDKQAGGQDVPIIGIVKRESDETYYRLVVPLDTLLHIFEKDLNESRELASIRYKIKLNTNQDYPDIRNELYEMRDSYNGTGVIFDFSDNYAETTGMLSLLRTILTIGTIALAAVWLTGIFTMLNTVNTSVLNRADELAMLRMIGMSRKMMKKTVLMESSIYCGFSTVIGGILGISGSLYIMLAMSIFNEQPEMVFVTFGIVLAAVVISNFLISRVAALPSLHTLKRYMDSGRMMQ